MSRLWHSFTGSWRRVRTRPRTHTPRYLTVSMLFAVCPHHPTAIVGNCSNCCYSLLKLKLGHVSLCSIPLHNCIDAKQVIHSYVTQPLQLVETEQSAHGLRVQLTSLQGSQKEMQEQLSERSHQVSSLKAELERTVQQNQAMAEEIAMYENKMRKLKEELGSLQGLSKQSEQEVRKGWVALVCIS